MTLLADLEAFVHDHGPVGRMTGDATQPAWLRSLVLDGEVTIFDQKLRSRFAWLREPDPDAVPFPVILPLVGMLELKAA